MRWRKGPLRMLALYGTVLWGLSLWGLLPAKFASLSLPDLGDKDRLLAYLSAIASAAIVNMSVFAVLGGLAAAVPAKSRGFRWLVQMLVCGTAISFAVMGVALLSAARSWPESIDAVAPSLGCALGAWIVGLWRYGFWTRLSLAAQAVLLPLSLCVIACASLAAEPLPFSAAEISSAEKRRLVELVRSSEVEVHADVLVRTLQLSQRDVNLLMNWGSQVAYGNDTPSKSAVRLADDDLTLIASLLIPPAGDRYLNVVASGAVEVQNGQLELKARQLRVGRLEVPSVLLPLVSDLLKSFIRSEPELERILSRTPLIQIESSGVTVALEKGAFREEGLAFLETIDPAVLAATVAQLRHLQARLDPKEAANRKFETYVRAAFMLAAQRTADGHSAVDENRAAIYALGTLLGHPRLGKMILGRDFDDASYAAAAAHTGRVPLRGRRDWTRHFAVSAVLATYANRVVSDAAGVLKEELDAGDNGSGFSFADLMADRAGTRFALAATRDEAAAHACQRRMLGPWDSSALFPAATDLPEGLTDAQLQQQFGGVGGEAYQQLIQTIERRLDDCPLLR